MGTTTSAGPRGKRFERLDLGGVVRWQLSDTDGWYHLHAAGVGDESPQHLTYADGSMSGYNSACGMCWLGYGHTDAYHAREVSR